MFRTGIRTGQGKTTARVPRILLLAFLAVFLLAGCGEDDGDDVKREQVLYINYLNSDEDGFLKEEYDGEMLPVEDMMDELMTRMQVPPEDVPCSALLPDRVKLQRRVLENGLLTMDFSEEYEKMESTREVLARAGIVRTMVQIPEVSEVLFTVDGKPAHTPAGVELGVMNADSFVEDAGKQINAIQHTAINLYFTDLEGDSLTKEARSIYYSASKPLEWAIVERVIAGPKVQGNFPTVPAATQIISVSSSGGICYVNLTQSFLSNTLVIGEKIPIYSIVNSVTDNCRDVTAVQISVDGDSNIIFRQETDLSKPFEPDWSLVVENREDEK